MRIYKTKVKSQKDKEQSQKKTHTDIIRPLYNNTIKQKCYGQIVENLYHPRPTTRITSS